MSLALQDDFSIFSTANVTSPIYSAIGYDVMEMSVILLCDYRVIKIEDR